MANQSLWKPNGKSKGKEFFVHSKNPFYSISLKRSSTLIRSIRSSSLIKSILSPLKLDSKYNYVTVFCNGDAIDNFPVPDDALENVLTYQWRKYN
jgi:hypothetical protein